MKFDEIHKILQEIAPEELQESWDNSGIQICTDHEKDISNILVCLEINDKILNEAISYNSQLIVTHHPLIFGSLSRIDDNNITDNLIISLIKNGISVYSSHTAFDSSKNGTNQYLAEQIGLLNIIPMIPSDMEKCGMGRIGYFDKPVNLNALIDMILQKCGKSDIRIAGRLPEKISKVALCTGAGADFITEAYRIACDAYITGDVKYHDARLAYDLGLCVIDAGHYGTEVIFADNMAAQLRYRLPDSVKVIEAVTDIYPFIGTDDFI